MLRSPHHAERSSSQQVTMNPSTTNALPRLPPESDDAGPPTSRHMPTAKVDEGLRLIKV